MDSYCNTICTHHVSIGLIVESLSKDCYDKDVDEEGDEKSDSGLDEEVLVGFLYFLFILAINVSRLVHKKDKCHSSH